MGVATTTNAKSVLLPPLQRVRVPVSEVFARRKHRHVHNSIAFADGNSISPTVVVRIFHGIKRGTEATVK